MCLFKLSSCQNTNNCSLSGIKSCQKDCKVSKGKKKLLYNKLYLLANSNILSKSDFMKKS